MGASAAPAAAIQTSRTFGVSRRDPGSRARTGTLRTVHGTVQTPAFMPVATQGTVKGIKPAELVEMGAEMILANAYHLSLRPGVPTIEAMGGLHAFMGWSGSILTDSGGYQVFSLAALRKVSEDGVEFRSHLDGSRIFLTPEDVVDRQVRMGVDVLMPLDECVEAGAGRQRVEEAMQRTTRWALRSLHQAEARAFREGRLLFGIVQGGLFPELRQRHAGELAACGFPGYAVGGLSVGEERAVTRDVAAGTAAALPEDKPRYLMGVGLPQEILRFIAMGYDLFDCVLPTRNGRNGTCFTWSGRVNLRLKRHGAEARPLDESCACYTCRSFSLAYLRHLAVSGEMLGAQLASLHNVHFYQELVRQARRHVDCGDYGTWAEDAARRIEEGERA
jgi:queuine tRNA-ribosyltransferase